MQDGKNCTLTFVTRDGETCEGSFGEKGDDSEEEEDDEEESDGSFVMVPVDKEEEPGGSSMTRYGPRFCLTSMR